MKKIRAAISADTFLETTGVINQIRAPFAPRPLIDALANVGMISVILPYTEEASGTDYIDMFDVLVIPGGPNMAPRFYGEEPRWDIGVTYDKRDIFELSLIRAACRAGKPVLGICRGLQVINVAVGGSLYQNLQSEREGTFIQHAQKTPGDVPTHSVSIEENSVLGRIFGRQAFVNSRHREGVKKLGNGLKITARSPDGVVEGIESKGSEQIVAVQWHPENLWREHEEMKRFFTDFADRAERK